MKKKNVVLVSPSSAYDGKKSEQVVYPGTATMILSTILDREGYEVKLIDGNLYGANECIAKIMDSINTDTVFVGFSVMSSQVAWSYKVSKSIKSVFPSSCIIWGGAHPTLYPEQTVADDSVDIVAVNEACSTITQLTETIAKNGDLSGVPGIYFKTAKKITKTIEYIPDDIHKIPDINFSLFEASRYFDRNLLITNHPEIKEKLIPMPILTGLGCAYKCTFCINVILGRKYRFRSAAEIVQRIEYLQKTYRANFFQFLDEDFFISKKRTFEFLDLVEKKNLKFYFRPWIRVSYFNDEYLSVDVAKRLGKIGMAIAVMGAECGSQSMLDKLQKGIKVEDTLRSVRTLSHTSIKPKFSMMVGLPGETKREILATFRLALKLISIDRRTELPILSFALYPGSPIYTQAIKDYGFREPSTLAEWAEVDFSGFLGFYFSQNKPWIFNRKVFERMNYLYNLVSHFDTKKGRIYVILRGILLEILKIRFWTRWFYFPFEEYLLKSYLNIKLCIRNSTYFLKPKGENT